MPPLPSLFGASAVSVPAWLILPFALLLLLIAVMPLTPPGVKHLWEKYYPHVAIGLGLLVVAWYLGPLQAGPTVRHTLHEYFSFIALIGSLFVVAGGIHIGVKGGATRFRTSCFSSSAGRWPTSSARRAPRWCSSARGSG